MVQEASSRRPDHLPYFKLPRRPSPVPTLYRGDDVAVPLTLWRFPLFYTWEQETLTQMQPQLAQAAIDTESLIKKASYC